MGRMALMAKMAPLGQLVVMDYRATLEYLYVTSQCTRILTTG